MPLKVRVVYIFVLFWLLGWFIKAAFFFPYLFQEITQIPLSNDFFPALWAEPSLAQLAYVLPALALAVFVRPSVLMCRIVAMMMVFCAAILVLHQDTCNDAMFVTSFWSALWFLWLVVNWEKGDEYLVTHSRRIGQWVIGVVFWAGFVGKLTPEYWSGEVFYNIFFVQNNEWLGRWLNTHLSVPQAHILAAVISCSVIVIEFFLSLAPFLPFTLIVRWGLILLPAIALFSTWKIFSVVSCLIGILLACRSWKKI